MTDTKRKNFGNDNKPSLIMLDGKTDEDTFFDQLTFAGSEIIRQIFLYSTIKNARLNNNSLDILFDSQNTVSSILRHIQAVNEEFVGVFMKQYNKQRGE